MTARVLLTGALLLVSAPMAMSRPGLPEGGRRSPSGDSAQSRQGVQEELAMIVPHFRTGDGSPLSLPRPLAPAEATLVTSVFRLQRQGAFPEALTSSTRLTDVTLLGDLQAERYLSPSYHPTVHELQLWLKAHSDMADAPAVYARLASLPDHGALPPAPSSDMLRPDETGFQSTDELHITRNPLLDRTVQERASSGVKGARSALHLVDITPGMTGAYAAQLGGEIARDLLASGDYAEALRTGEQAFLRGDRRVGEPAYVAGLAAWALGQHEEAATLFGAAARAPDTSTELRSGAAFWAARAHRMLGEASTFRPWLQRASVAPRSFYGRLATRMLTHEMPEQDRASSLLHPAAVENEIEAAPAAPVLTEIDIEAVSSLPVGRRFFALLQVGEQRRAEEALRRYWPKLHNDTAMARSMQIVAEAAGLTDLSLQMSDALASTAGGKASPLPLPPLHPHHGFTVDPALVYALTHLESNFNAGAVSGAGAHGLMQIQPVTAGFVTGEASRFTDTPDALHDPGLNLDIGQAYLQYLARLSLRGGKHVPAGGDMIRMLAGYNAGPGAISRWEGHTGATDDPFLYIEALPSPETRAYVRQALTALWNYADRLKLPKPSLEALAAGEWPAFAEEQKLALSSMRRPRLLH
ncbi:transglycosylase SLT domain-containing protein [Acetobacter sp. AN02]|nr:transglycosylase SLT domain-containing protein [Acetobacter sp. AN02]MDG6094921.1 transglycosylase SLT domain-containing protein [Acetobacter sp. AN02]